MLEPEPDPVEEPDPDPVPVKGATAANWERTIEDTEPEPLNTNLASEATSVLPLVGPELDLEPPGLVCGRKDLANSFLI